MTDGSWLRRVLLTHQSSNNMSIALIYLRHKKLHPLLVTFNLKVAENFIKFRNHRIFQKLSRQKQQMKVRDITHLCTCRSVRDISIQSNTAGIPSWFLALSPDREKLLCTETVPRWAIRAVWDVLLAGTVMIGAYNQQYFTCKSYI